jgi:ABC-type Fe3+ transport system permease subunit
LAPTLTVSVLYVLLRTFREYSASIFLTAVGTEVFSVLVLDMWSGGNSNILAAYVIMVMALLSVLAGGLFWVSSKSSVRA